MNIHLPNHIPDQETDKEFLCLLLANIKRIYSFILTLVPNISDADDILQESVLIMFRKFEHFDKKGSFGAWGIGIARNEVLKLRTRQNDKRIRFSDDVSKILEEASNSITDQQQMRVEALQGCLKKLPESDQQFIKMKYEIGLPIKDISDAFKMSKRNIFRLAAKIHRSLLKCIQHSLNT